MTHVQTSPTKQKKTLKTRDASLEVLPFFFHCFSLFRLFFFLVLEALPAVPWTGRPELIWWVCEQRSACQVNEATQVATQLKFVKIEHFDRMSQLKNRADAGDAST